MTSSKDRVVRHRFTLQQRQQLLARFHRSQLTVKQFATRHGVGLSTLSKWLEKERRGGDPAMSFQEVVVPPAAPKWAAEFISPKGWTVRLHDSSAIRTMPKVLRALC
jgi:transposase-like protein